MKIFKISYYLDSADGYIIDEKNNVVSCDGDTHINFIISHYDLSDDLEKVFRDNFGQELSWDKDWETITEYVEDFMIEKEIFPVIVDWKNSQVYVRPVGKITPSKRKIKELSDWAIETGRNEEIIVDYVTANDKNKKVYASKETEEPKIYTERLNDRTKYNLIINGEKVGHLTVQENLSDHYYVLTALKIYKDELKRLGHGTALMNMMLSDSKYLDKPIIVSPYPYDENEIEVEDLRSFYAKFGFVPSEESQYSMILER
jgi:hypothetical protein